MNLEIPDRIKLLRFDVKEEDEEKGATTTATGPVIEDINPKKFRGPITRESVISTCNLPEDSIIKLYYEGKLIPWSIVSSCSSIDIQVFRPHQNVKPQVSDGKSTSDVLIREKVKELEGRISSLEAVADPAIISHKTERDLQLLTKQISFLAKRLDEADQAEWVKKP